MKPCLYCGAECAAIWSPADAKAERFPACNWVHATMALVRRAGYANGKV